MEQTYKVAFVKIVVVEAETRDEAIEKGLEMINSPQVDKTYVRNDIYFAKQA